MINVNQGDRVIITKGGTFGEGKGRRPDRPTRHIDAGTVGHVKTIFWKLEKKKSWAHVEFFGTGGNSLGTYLVPAWWLRPKSILDDLAEI